MWRALSWLNRLQKTANFKWGVTAFTLSAAVFGYLWLLNQWTHHTDEQHLIEFHSYADGRELENFGLLTDLLHTPDLQTEAGVVVAVVAAAMIVLGWLGVGATVVGLLLFGGLVAFPLTFFPQTTGLGELLVGVIPLAFLFTTLLELARIALSPATPTLAIARNVLNEAVRMKIALIFIVAIMFLLAFVPTFINEAQPLRYRVQQWLQWGTGLTGALAAMLTIFFGCATVAFEQRDRIIWQTVTKPVSSIQYVLGKWLGIMTVNAVILAVMAGGVFMFTEYLRLQPADGEIAHHRIATGQSSKDDPNLMTVDRRLLEQQVLVAREGLKPESIDMEREDIQAEITRLVNRTLEDIQVRQPDREITPQLRAETRQDITEQIDQAARSVQPGGFPLILLFTELDDVPEDGGELTLRYKFDAGSNDPSVVYRFMFVINQASSIEQEVVLGTTQTLSIRPEAIIREGENAGRLLVEVYADAGNRFTATVPPDDGVELLVTRGSYPLNFTRIMVVMFIKLGFIAAVAVMASTIVSFPVACMVTLIIWTAAELSGFLYVSLEWFQTRTHDGNTMWLNLITRELARPIAWSLRTYSELRPNAKLVEGRYVGWGELAASLLIIGAWSIGALLIGIGVFRKRELALYSGK
ncbi:MAG: hypothetical protein AAGI30_07320 [Planctomycetota bacterium]